MEMFKVRLGIILGGALVLVLTLSSDFTFAGKVLSQNNSFTTDKNTANSTCQDCLTRQSFKFLRIAESQKDDSTIDISEIYQESTAFGGDNQGFSENERIQNYAKSSWEKGSRRLIFDSEGNIVRPYGITATPFHLMFGELE
jgi:hypothetical protein